jgi:hypothetical protein
VLHPASPEAGQGRLAAAKLLAVVVPEVERVG